MLRLVVGERFNAPCSLYVEQQYAEDHQRYIKLMRRLGAFSNCKERLATIGVTGDLWQNLLPPSPSCIQATWDHAAARAVASYITDVDVVFMCGRRVQRAFGVRTSEDVDVVWAEPVLIAVPHPSGLNRFWNDTARVLDAECLVREALRSCGTT